MAFGDFNDDVGDVGPGRPGPRRSQYAPSMISKITEPWANAEPDFAVAPASNFVPQAPDLGRAAPPPEAPVTTDHLGPRSPLDEMLGKYNASEDAYKALLNKGPEQFHPSIWRRLAGVAIGTGAGIGQQRMGYGRYSGFSANPEEASRVTRAFVFGPQSRMDENYKRQLEAARVGSEDAMKNYQLTRQQEMDDLQQRNIASEMEARNRPQIVEGYRVPQEGGPAQPIPIAPLPEGFGPNDATNLPEVINRKEQAPIDARAQAEADREKFAQEQQGRQFTEQEKLQQMRDDAAQRRAETARTQGAGLDRSYQFHTKEFDTIGKPIQDRMDRIQRLQVSLNQNSPQADALIAPELLTAMAGGQGSGLRMNEAEIARIVGGRNNWQTIKSQLSKWQSNPDKPFQILPDQRAQVRNLVNAMLERVQGKQQLLNDAQQRLADATDPAQHKQLLAETKKRLAAIDNIEDAVGKDQGGRIVYKSGGKYIYNDGSEYVPPQQPKK